MKNVVNEIEENLKELITKDDLDNVKFAMEDLKKDLSKYALTEELITRMSAMTSDTNVKLADRPTIGYFKKVLSTYDKKIDAYNADVKF